MRDVLSQIESWRTAGDAIATATVIQTWGSAPRGLGAKMAVTADGKIAGSVSGGCVEGAVVEAAQRVLRTGKPELQRFGVADDTAWSVGLACGGSIEVFVEALDPGTFEPLAVALREERPAATATVVAGSEDLLGRKVLVLQDGSAFGTLGGVLDGPAADHARESLRDGQCRRIPLEPVELFVQPYLGSPTLVIVGGVHIAIALTAIARSLGYRTVVVDPRKSFGSELRFPHADRLLHEWPDDALQQLGLSPSSAVAVLTHDPKLDDPALRVALKSPAFYVGALGGKATQQKRRKRLLEAGLTESDLARLHAPIGLDLGGRSPEEIALSVMAQVVAARNGRAGLR
jgi:xanthine dehydrogenase accessory factor